MTQTMVRFRYNSYHKIIAGLALVTWSMFHFLKSDKSDEHYPNGQVKRTGGMHDSKNHGTWTWYHENGEVKMRGEFNQGQRTGIWTTWSDEGLKLTEATYAQDRLNGWYTEWDENGNVSKKTFYTNDHITEHASR